ncbi:hypothetical protein HYALB_00010349 [Hymenoscyphus albidus]|uniref:Uncharacterized protein n=1 Tax=Hymenoscyphus albidus TaxID=595503 RepID=A0A9N9Q5E2_9HELO|nr:hypothetical protein HYALB_00010349 [Hymenoscyphus albidus]
MSRASSRPSESQASLPASQASFLARESSTIIPALLELTPTTPRVGLGLGQVDEHSPSWLQRVVDAVIAPAGQEKRVADWSGGFSYLA